MIVETVLMSPADAEKLLMLSQGMSQRAVRADRVARLTHAIRDGQWQLTHQPIALDAAGRVIDGQHRLTAIAAAGIPVEVMVARDVDPAVFAVVDTGASRSPADVLRIAGILNATQLAAAIRYLLAYERVAGTTETMARAGKLFTAQDILDLAQHPERGPQVQHAYAAARGIAAGLGHEGHVTWLTTVVVALRDSEVDDGLALHFLERLRDGASLPTGSPVLALRRFLIQETGLRTAPRDERAAIGIATTLKAFNAWVAGDVRQVMSFRYGMERMPVVLPPVESVALS
jgi:hypothetical protein